MRGAQPRQVTRRTARRASEEATQASETATAYDLLGKRWALQVVRELALGPRRFTDLHHSLTGISTNALAARLRELQRAQVVRRRLLPPPAAAAVYELTEGGTELGEIVVPLDRWGARSLAPATQDASNRRSARDEKRRDGRSRDVG